MKATNHHQIKYTIQCYTLLRNQKIAAGSKSYSFATLFWRLSILLHSRGNYMLIREYFKFIPGNLSCQLSPICLVNQSTLVGQCQHVGIRKPCNIAHSFCQQNLDILGWVQPQEDSVLPRVKLVSSSEAYSNNPLRQPRLIILPSLLF